MTTPSQKAPKVLVAEALDAAAFELERIRTLQVEAEERASKRHLELVQLLVDLRADFADLRKDLVSHKSDTAAEFRLRPVLSNGGISNGNGRHHG